MSDKCRVRIEPDDKLGLKIIVKGCSKELEDIDKKTSPFTKKWLNERIERHEWNDEET